MKFFGLIVFFSFALAAAIAQEPRFKIHNIGDENGGLNIEAILQDHQCMIWLGTQKGLSRYDGSEWYDIKLNDSDTTYEVTALFEDDDNRIWVGTSAGHVFYMDRSRKAYRFSIDEGNPRKPITDIAQDRQGYIWFATYGEGAYVYTGSRLFNFNMDDGLTGNDIYAMTCTPEGEIWLGTDDGISVCTFINEIKSIRTFGMEDGLPDQIITALHADAKGNVWIGTFEKGVVYFDAKAKTVNTPFSNSNMDKVTSLTLFDDDELWIGTHSSGVWRYSLDLKFARRIENLYKLRQGRVTGLLADVEGNIWVTMDEGMLVSAFRPFESLEVNLPEMQTLFEDSKSRLWIGTKDGLYRIEDYPAAQSKPIRVLPDLPLNITQILEDKFHQLWIGTIDKGLFVFNPTTGIVRHIGSILNEGGYAIMSMASSTTEIWISTLEGVMSYPANSNILKEPKPRFKLLHDLWQSNLHFVFQVFVDSKERVWFATDGNGIFSIEGTTLKEHVGSDSLEITTVYGVCEDHRGHMWFNTPEHGLIEFDGQYYRPLGIKEGLGNFKLASIYTCSTGDIIITHEKGIDVMEPGRRHFMYYSHEIGVSNLEPSLNAGTLSAKGQVYTSGRGIIFKYHTPHRKLSIHPRTQLTEVRVFNQPVDFTTPQTFSHAQNYISFNYVGLWYTSPSSVKYLCMLEGYDLQWKESKDNVASYSNLQPGDYTFLVKASENNFFLDEPVDTYSFSIAKPFWLQIWFIILAVIACAAALYWLIKSREYRSGKQALLKKEMIESQLSALKAQINPHFLFNSFNTLITIIDENAMKPEVAIEYVEKMADFYRSILQYREQEFITLEEEWEMVKNFMYLLGKRYGNNLRLHLDPPPKDTFILPMTLQMLVENAVKHNIISEKYPLDLYITVDHDHYVTVTNNLQPKSKAEPSTQFGLQSILRRYQLISDRSVIIEKSEHSFIVRIPLIKK